jgi:hypothetical protein
MQKDFLDSALAIGGFLMGAGTMLIGIVGWIWQSSRKRYAAERDFEHLKKAYQQLAENQGLILRELEERADRLQNALERQQLLLQVVLTKVSGSDESIGTMLNQLRQQ